MEPNRDNDQWQSPSVKDSFNIFCGACNAVAACVLPFLRKGFGKNYPGAAGFFGLLIMILYSAFAHVPEMLTYIGVWLVALFVQKGITSTRARDGKIVHSRYWGDPILSRLFKSDASARSFEPVLGLMLGGLLMYWSPGVGGFVMVAGFASAIATGIVIEENRKRLQAMRDAEIEQRFLARQYRGEIEELN